MEKNIEAKQEIINPYQQSIEQFTEKIMDYPGENSKVAEINSSPEEFKLAEVNATTPIPSTDIEIKT